MPATANVIEKPNGSKPSLREEPALEGERSLWELPTRELLEQVASTDPTPGGGSAAIKVACMGTALLRKAFAVSVKKERHAINRRQVLETALAHLDAKASTFRNGVDQDVAAFDSYISALRLPHSDPTEPGTCEKNLEETLELATSTPVALASEMHSLFRFTLDQLPSIHDVILSDAITGLRLLNVATECLLLTAESNLAKVSNPMFHSTMSHQIRDLRHLTTQAESQLACRLHNRQLTRS